MSRLGILAYGSLMYDPGAEIEAATARVIPDVETPFEIEYARKSSSRSNAPTLIPVPDGKGARVNARIIVLKPEISEDQAKNFLYRRELHRVADEQLKYATPSEPSNNRVTIEIAMNLCGVETVLYTQLGSNLPDILSDAVTPEIKAAQLAELAIASLTEDTFKDCKDGIWYLAQAIDSGVQTPLTNQYYQTILRTTGGTADLYEARLWIARNRPIRVESALPPNVYRVAQRRFDAIPGSPWVYWVSDGIRALFEKLPSMQQVAQPRVGTQTADNARFLRYWWEVGSRRIGVHCGSWKDAKTARMPWLPYMKGGEYRKWYGNQDHVVNWHNEAEEIYACKPAAVIRNPDYYFREGVTWTDLGASGFSARISPGGFIFDVSGSCAFPEKPEEIPGLLAIMNAGSSGYFLSLLNPTMHFQVGDLARLPILDLQSSGFRSAVAACVRASRLCSMQDETTFDFIGPPRWDTGPDDVAAAQERLARLERQIDDEVYRLYGISDEDRAALEAELAGGNPAQEGGDRITDHELAIRWISCAVGIVLGTFQPGVTPRPAREGLGEGRTLGSAIYRRSDFAIGSLPAPDEAEFDQLVGPAERFAYVDDDGGRHLFPAEVEQALHDLALPDGIAVLDEGHPRDLAALVEQALALMLDVRRKDVMRNGVMRDEVSNEESGYALRFTHDGLRSPDHAPDTTEVIRIGADGDLRKFLSRDFFTKHHFRWYRKRPVYWPLQSAKRSYGFVLFHENVDRNTLYVLQRDYLDHKLNGLRLEIGDLQGQLANLSGTARKRMERQIDSDTQLLEELTEFAKALERVVRQGYRPEDNWIDDGVILRLAPLWELIPIWRSEPKKYWRRLEGGDLDWSHIAKHYWPDRVLEKCKTNKSFAIAHGVEGSMER